MLMLPVKSSNIKKAGHDPVKNVLRVEFSNGTEYEYKDVNARTFSALMGAKSQGKFFNKNIKNTFASSRVTEKSKNDQP